MQKCKMILILWSFALYFTTLLFSQGAIKRKDVLMAFTFTAGDSKIGEVADGVLEDVSGNGHDGEFTQKPKWANGVWGAGLQVGQAQGGWHAVTVPHTNEMDLEEFAIGAWVKTENLIGDCCNMIVSKESWVGGLNRNYSMWMREQVTVGFTTTNPFDDVQARGIVITDGKWHHAVGTYDGTDLTQYVDGVAYGKNPVGGHTPSFNPSQQLHIGATWLGGLSLGMHGVVDDVVVFNRGLTEEEVITLMDQGLEKLLGFQAVNPEGKMATTWAGLKSAKY